MSRLDPDDEARLKEIFADLQHEVTIHLASDDDEVVALIEAVTGPSAGRVKIERLAPGADDERIRALGIEHTPGMALVSPLTHGRLLFYGAPHGYEMMTFLAALVDIGGGSEDAAMISAAGHLGLDALATDVHILVFSTPG